jgi:HAD superfamily hydrolase (TIGR01509 family)
VAHHSLTRRSGRWPMAVVFDFDGVLADTDVCWRAAYERCLQRRGRELDLMTSKELVGASVSSAAERLGVPVEELGTELEASFRNSPIVANVGVKTLLRGLSGQLPMAVATNGPERLVRLGLVRIGVSKAFSVLVSAEHVANPKPAPDVYVAACVALGVDPSDAIAIEDSKVGVQAAASAGMTVISVPTSIGGRVKADLQAHRLDDPVVLRYLGIDVLSVRQSPPGLSPS